MRIAVTIERLDPRRGGAEVATARLISQLTRRGHEVSVLARELTIELPAGAAFEKVRIPWPTIALRHWFFAREVKRRLRAGNFDLSVACGRGYAEDAVWAQNGAHAAAVAGEIRSYYFSPFRQAVRRYQDFYSAKAWVYRELERRRFARVPQPFVIAVSNMVADDYHRDYAVSRDLIRVVHNHVAIDANRFSREAMSGVRAKVRATLQLNSTETVIVCVAQNFKRKGVRPLLGAAARLQERRRDFRIVIAGATREHAASYERQAARRGCADRVRFISHQSRIEELYAASDVFCLPTFYDPCSLTVFEAMACGLPVVTSRFNGAAEVIEPGANGFVVQEPQDITELAERLEILCDPTTRVKMSKAAQNTANNLSLGKSADEIVDVIEELARCKHDRLATETN